MEQLMSNAFFVKFRVFKIASLQKYRVYGAQIFLDS